MLVMATGCTTRAVGFGRPAATALRRLIDEVQGDDPLAPVTALVPRSAVGLATRRLLASGDLGAGRRGLVNVRFLTLGRLADELGGARLAAAGRRPASDAVVRAGVRAALAEAPTSLFEPVRGHAATARALTMAYRDLAGLPDAVRRRLAAASPRAAEVVALVDDVGRRLAGWYDEADVLAAAAEAVAEAADVELAPLGHVVVHLPLRLSPPALALVAALARRRPVTVLVGCTGSSSADEAVRVLLERLSSLGAVAAGPADRLEAPVGSRVLSAPSADAEVLSVVRSLMAKARDGVPLERMAVAFAGPGPYPRLVRESLEQAAVPYNAGGMRPLSATVPGRTILGLFELAERGWRRDDVAAWLAGAPILHRGREVPATAWDLVSRRAGVVGGRDAWATHLSAFVAGVGTQLAGLDDGQAEEVSEGRRAGWERDVREGEDLAHFLADLGERLDRSPRSWAEWSAWGERLLADLLGSAARRASWPPDEQEAFTSVSEALGRLTLLDGVEPRPEPAAFRAALGAELEAVAPQTSQVGHGVQVGHVAELVGMDLDAVFVVGMDEGSFPLRRADDPLLPDDERAAAGPDVPLRSTRAAETHRDFLAALAAAPERTLSFARFDQTHGREQRPSRWLLDTLEALQPEGSGRLYGKDLAGGRPLTGLTELASYTATVRADGEPSSLVDRDLRSLLRWRDAGGALDRHYLAATDPVLGAGLVANRERRSGRFTRFDGRIERDDIPSPAAGAAQSATGLESYAACPRRYLFAKLLRVTVRERPEEVLRISPADKGQLVHRILELFVADEIARPFAARISPGEPWPAAAYDRMAVVAKEVFAEYEQAGLVGRPLLWELDRATVERDLSAFLDHDARYRAETGMVPAAVELRFGPGVGAPVTVALDGERTLSFRGFVDRVDRSPDGSGVTVIDYKTGRDYGFDELAEDPVVRGQKLQLPVYGLAARGAFAPSQPVRALYWFVSGRVGFRQVPVELSDAHLQRFDEVVTVLVDGIEAGHFPARPGSDERGDFANCHFCDFKGACPADKGRAWDRLAGDPALARYVALAEPQRTGGRP